MAEGQRQRPCRGRHHHPVAAKGLSYTQQMASALALQQEGKLPLDRQQATDLLKAQLALEPQLYGAFAGFEPNGFDGQDASFAGQTALGSDSKGRFVPYFYRDKESIGTDLLLSIEKSDPDEFGNPANDYYACPKREGRSCLIDPFKVDINGQQVLVSTITTPIMVGGQFKDRRARSGSGLHQPSGPVPQQQHL